MGEARHIAESEYPTVFAEVLAELSGYTEVDMAELADSLAGPYGDMERNALLARLVSAGARSPRPEFMSELASNLDLSHEAMGRLAVALVFERRD